MLLLDKQDILDWILAWHPNKQDVDVLEVDDKIKFSILNHATTGTFMRDFENYSNTRLDEVKSVGSKTYFQFS